KQSATVKTQNETQNKAHNKVQKKSAIDKPQLDKNPAKHMHTRVKDYSDD
ncbi:25984_t:CDS:1, partial [Dentiscutata erythropus]